MGAKSFWKTILFRSKIMYFHNKNRVKKLHLHCLDRFRLNFFSHSKKHAKIMKKTQCFITFASKKSLKITTFPHKNNAFSRKKTSKSCEKIIPGNANGQACDRTFSRWKIKKKVKINAQKCWKTQSFNTFGAKMHWNVYFFRSKSCFLNAFSPQKSSKCNELITTLHVIGNMKNRIFCYEKTMES